MSLLPPSILDALAGKIAHSILPTLQSAMRTLSSQSTNKPRVLGSLWKGFTAAQGGSSGSGGSSPASASLPPASISKIVANATTQVAAQQQQHGQAWWKRGFSALQNGKKRSAGSRAARLTVIASKRLSAAKSAVKASNAAKNSPGWHPAAHGALLAAKNAAQQKLAQATNLQARTTLLGSLSSGKVASGLTHLAEKIPALATRLAIPLAIGAAIVRAPFQIAKLADGQIASLRERNRNSGWIENGRDRMAAAFAQYDARTSNIKTLNARDTAGSTEFLIDQQNKLRSTLRPIQAAFTNGVNNTLGAAAWASRKFIEGYQLEADVALAGHQTFVDLLNGKVSDPRQKFQDIQENRAEQQKKDDEKQAQTFSQTGAAWVREITGNTKNDARFNNIQKPDLRPIR